MLSIVIPTRNEGGNVDELVRRLDAACVDLDAEVLFVDDSTDDTPDVVRRVAARSVLPVRLLHRAPEQRIGGLSGAVVHGLRAAAGTHVVVMDGDLQHPPELVRELVAAAADCDLVVASRYCGNGDSAGLSNGWRRGVSTSSTLLARALFPRRVGGCTTDPMTGFFLVRRDAVDVASLRPRGFKILLELLATHALVVREVPLVFGLRFAGQSKASWRQGMRFGQQLLALRLGRLGPFAMVGAVGVVVNLAAMAALIALGMHYVAASLLSTELAILSNFLLAERFVFHDLRRGGLAARAGKTFAFNNVENLLRLPFLIALVELFGLPGLVAQALLIGLAFTARYAFVRRFVYPSAVSVDPYPLAAPVREPASAA